MDNYNEFKSFLEMLKTGFEEYAEYVDATDNSITARFSMDDPYTLVLMEKLTKNSEILEWTGNCMKQAAIEALIKAADVDSSFTFDEEAPLSDLISLAEEKSSQEGFEYPLGMLEINVAFGTILTKGLPTSETGIAAWIHNGEDWVSMPKYIISDEGLEYYPVNRCSDFIIASDSVLHPDEEDVKEMIDYILYKLPGIRFDKPTEGTIPSMPM